MGTAVTPRSELHTKPWRGVPPIRAGEGHSFLLRKLHSLSGIVPIGAFLLEHFVSNAEANSGPHAYAQQTAFLTSMPFVFWLELFFIWLPIAFHAVYGLYIWYRSDPNLRSYPWAGNWLYSLQRWTGVLALAYMIQHVWFLRFSGVHLGSDPGAAFAKVQHELLNPWMLAWYTIGILSASWHLGYGVFLFCAKWGIVTGRRARRGLMGISLAIFALFAVVGLVTMTAFLRPQWRNDYVTGSLTDVRKAKAIQAGTDPMSQHADESNHIEHP